MKLSKTRHLTKHLIDARMAERVFYAQPKPKEEVPAKAKRRTRTQLYVASRNAERQFVASVAAVKPTKEASQRAAELVEHTRSAKDAGFLDRYRLAAA
jgi:hypothetical protein